MSFKGIDNELLKQLDDKFDKEPQNFLAMNMVNKSGVSAAIRDYELNYRMKYKFNLDNMKLWILKVFKLVDYLILNFVWIKQSVFEYGESLMTHAMVFTGVDLDNNDKPIKWKVENSWGKDSGNNGFYIMSDEWFSEYMYQIVINKKYLKEEWIKQYEAEPIVLQPWDPMGSLAL